MEYRISIIKHKPIGAVIPRKEDYIEKRYYYCSLIRIIDYFLAIIYKWKFGMSKTSTTVKDRYNAKAYEQITLRLKRGGKDKIKERASALRISVNSYINNLINQDMSRS